jgi:tetratricopeptide (TPR) repeat protein
MIGPVRVILHLTVGLFMLAGCAAGQYPLYDASAVDPVPTIAALTAKATVYEAADEIQLALICWRSILDFDPHNAEALDNLNRLATLAARRARDAYLEGQKALAQGQPQMARQWFLATLRLNPKALEARQQLHQLMNAPSFRWHSLQPGESLANLSLQFYGTATGADLIAFVNDIPANAEVLVPRSLKIPALAAHRPYKTQQTQQTLARARALSQAGQHAKVLSITEPLLRANPKLSPAVELQNQSCYILGKRLFQEKRYTEARQMLAKIQGAQPGLENLRAELDQAMQQQAETYYRDGVKYFLSDELERAIESWRLTLELDPEHQEAAASINDAQTLLQKLKTVEE